MIEKDNSLRTYLDQKFDNVHKDEIYIEDFVCQLKLGALPL